MVSLSPGDVDPNMGLLSGIGTGVEVVVYRELVWFWLYMGFRSPSRWL